MAKIEPDNPVCGVCRRMLKPGDQVVVGQAELIHVECQPTGSDLGDRAQELLRQRDVGYCHACVAALLGTPYEDVRKAVTGLRANRDVVVRVTTCAQCDKPRVTIRMAPARAPSRFSADDRWREQIAERLRTGRLPRFRPAFSRPGQTEVTIFTGRGSGKLCSACDAIIQETDRSAVEVAATPGHVVRFHQRCYRIWAEEARRLPSPPGRG